MEESMEIKVEPDFYFPAAELYGQDDDDDGGDDDLGEEHLALHQIELDSPAKQKIHTGEKPYRCEICSLRFAQSCNLQTHYRRNHGVDPRVNPQLFNKLRRQSSGEASSPTNSAMGARASPSWPQSSRVLPKLTPRPDPGSQPFLCCVCDEPFYDQDLLLIHEETHAPEAPFDCRYCSTMYASLSSFRAHVSLHRISLNKFGSMMQGACQSQIVTSHGSVTIRRIITKPAPEVNNANTVLNANQPFVSSNDPEYPYKCSECKKNFQKHELYYHMKVHLKQKNIFSKKSLKCDKCGKVFEKELTLKKHMDVAHPTVSSASSDNTLLLEALKSDPRAMSPAVNRTGMVQLSPEVELLPIDVTIKQEPESALGDDEVNSTVSDNPILTQLLNNNSELSIGSSSVTRIRTPVIAAESDASNEGGFIISAVATVDHSFLEQLDEIERNQKNQQQHEQEEMLVQPMPTLRRMPVLEESLRRPPVTTSTAANANNNNTNSIVGSPLGAGPFRCSFCHKLFNEHFGLRQHMRAMHYSEKRYKCKECNKKFTLGISLATHLRVHTAVQPFTCIVCYKTFTRSTSLNGHLSSHSYGRVKCAECGETQISVFNYMKHIEKLHPDFMMNVATYRQKAEALLQRRRELVLEITKGLAKHRSEIPNVLARLRGEVPLDKTPLANKTVLKTKIKLKRDRPVDDEVSSSEQVYIKKEKIDTSQEGVVSSASEEREARRSLRPDALPALRAELRKRPLRSNTRSNDLEDLVLPPHRQAKPVRTAGNSSPNLKRLLEQDNSGLAVSVKNEPSE